MRSARTKLPVRKSPRSTPRRRKRAGAVLVWFALLLVMLLGMVGLVIDGGFLMATHRHAQNAADAAALAAAFDLMYGASPGGGQIQATADTYVKTHNGLSDATVTVHIPPTSGHYTGSGYVEVLVDDPVSTFFIQILPGIDPNQMVRGRAVAGFEMVTSGAGVCVLNPDARPGLSVGGTGRLVVNGLVIDNSEGGGVDENGVPVNNGNNGTAASVSNNGQFLATNVRVVGGVNNPANFEPYYAGDPPPLHCKQLPFPDPLLNLATPTESNGVINENRGDPNASNLNPVLNDPSGRNYILSYGDDDPNDYYIEDPVNDPANTVPTMVLHPGIYNSIDITGGKVYFIPGIYVVSAKKANQNAVKITGGNVMAQGIMIYNTGNSYDAISGAPDCNDRKQKPPIPGDDSMLGSLMINAGMLFSPIDHTKYNYGSQFDGDAPVSSEFDGMLFYQRRGSSMGLDIQGDADQGMLEGTLYAKWGHTKISGQGTYDAQFVVGSIAIAGQGDVTIDFVGGKKGKAPQIFLVE